ncbi:RNA helicase [Mortierella sp. GBA30]|nr:RNA helicase [Mortierella sp. GBA30]
MSKDAYNLLLAYVVTTALICIPVTIVVASRFWAALPRNRPFSRSTRTVAVTSSSSSASLIRLQGKHGATLKPKMAASEGSCPKEMSEMESTTQFECNATIFLGSGGHTAEMLQLVSGLQLAKYPLRHYVVGWDDDISVDRVHRLESTRGQTDLTAEYKDRQNGAKRKGFGCGAAEAMQDLRGYTVHRIPRSRYVRQSLMSTPITLIRSLMVALPLIKNLTCLDTSGGTDFGFKRKRSILLMNGPGTCVALALAVIGARMIGVPDEATPDLVFVESFARVRSLSLAGKLLYPLCDVFLVQWPGLLDRHAPSSLRSYPSHGATAPFLSQCSAKQHFSTSWTAAVYAKRTPRPKQRVVKEQKLQASRSTALQSTSRKSGHDARFSGKSPSADQVIRSKTRQWKKIDERDSLSPPGSRTGAGAEPKKRVHSTTISVTSLEKGSRNPQFEHSFAPGFSIRTGRHKGPLVKTGNAGRDKAAAAERTLIEAGAKRKSGPKVRGFVPVRFALKPIASDVNLNLVSNRKIPLSKYAQSAAAPTSTTAGKEESVFAQAQESVQEMLDKVANSRFQGMGLHPDVERGVLELLAKPHGGLEPVSSSSSNNEALSGIKPTEIQALTIPASIDPYKKSPYTLCAAETGSGKTLAYLVPIMHELKIQEDKAVQAFKDEGGVDQEGSKVRALNTIRQFNQPRAIVLLPSRELVAQVSGILKELSHTVKLRTLTISHAMSPKSVIQRLASGPVDIVVATPASLLDYLPPSESGRRGQQRRNNEEEEKKTRGSANLFDENRLSLSSLRHLVIDEADSMFDRGFGTEVTRIVQQAKAVSSAEGPAKITVVSATLPKQVSDTLDDTLPGLLKITTPSLHKSLPGLHQTFLDLKPYFGNRPKAILDILAKQQQVAVSRSGSKRKENTLIFCNTKHSCELLCEHLKTNKVPGVLGVLHGEAANRDEILRQFTDDSFTPPPASAPKSASSPSSVGGKILISTDIASRGIDTTAVQHVILYDFPVTIVDYLHRVGRTARGGRGGRATSLVGRKDRNMAERIMVGIRMGKVLS